MQADRSHHYQTQGTGNPMSLLLCKTVTGKSASAQYDCTVELWDTKLLVTFFSEKPRDSQLADPWCAVMTVPEDSALIPCA